MSMTIQQDEITSAVERRLSVPPIDLDGLARDLGLRVAYQSLPHEILGKIERQPPTYLITINSDDPVRRRRFTLAHELSHYLLHRDLIGDGIVDDGLYRSALSTAIERQANRYAAGLLMPAGLVRQAWRAGCTTPEAMSERFNVSAQSAQIRLRDLNLVA